MLSLFGKEKTAYSPVEVNTSVVSGQEWKQQEKQSSSSNCMFMIR
jgi:hypothetical protein